MLLFALCLAAITPFAAAVEHLAKPRSAPKSFLRRVRLLNVMPVLVTFATVLMVSYRPAFSFAATAITFGAVVVINNAKYAILREPLVFSDFALLREAIRHPNLYVKHIGIANVVGVAVLAVSAIFVGLVFEPPLRERVAIQDYVPSAIYLIGLAGLIYAITHGPLRKPMRDFLRKFGATTDVSRDMDQLSLVACLVIYFFLADEPIRTGGKNGKAASSTAGMRSSSRRLRYDFMPVGTALPDIVVVQSESFFDARLVHASLPKSLLETFDEVCASAVYHGRLAVPAWGANTMRTEFAVLSGLPNEALGVNRFNPYRSIRKRPIWTLAHQLRAMGYRTVCIHPFDQEFFDRDKVFPHLGFDEFIDVTAFAGAATFGPYVCDTAVADKIIEQLDEDDGRPRFVFAITMENHGKWEPARLIDEPPSGLYHNQSPFGSPAFGCYLTHLQHTETLIARITAALDQGHGNGVFTLYGDHVPSLPDVFTITGFDDPRTNYFIWRAGGMIGQRIDTSADTLNRLIFHAAFDLPDRSNKQDGTGQGNSSRGGHF